MPKNIYTLNLFENRQQDSLGVTYSVSLGVHTLNTIISIQNLFEAWKEFLNGKKNRVDVQEFQLNLMDNIISLHKDLTNKAYVHGGYIAFNISDPKPRNIHKATVRDRLLHHAIYRQLYPYFDKRFVHDSYSCRNSKGTHKAMERFKGCFSKESKNNTRSCFVLKCDVKKFFASIDQQRLISILSKHIENREVIGLLTKIIGSFHSTYPAVGLPLGNLTSQLLVNIYMNEFDQHMKHVLKVKYYIRYADDFVILSHNKQYLEELLPQISNFLLQKLKLTLHPEKVFIKPYSLGVDFLGWIHFPNHRVLRSATKRRMFKNLQLNGDKPEVVVSYLGMLKHGNSWKLQQKVISILNTKT